MYLSEYFPEKFGLSLWKCPLCKSVRANPEISARNHPASGSNRQWEFNTWRRGSMLSNQPANSLRPLCFEHHTEMSLVQMVSGNGGTPPQELEYACKSPDCLVRYTGVDGYFIAPRDGSGLENEILPLVHCPHDKALMHLAQVRTEARSFRFWRCPLCKAVSRNGQVLAAGI